VAVAEGEYACPVTGKVFTPHTHIVAIKTTGNVYCYDAVDELCIKPKNWKVGNSLGLGRGVEV
jgi:peptidyl-prolyl cis-trans isomerase-like protein 2